MTFQLSLTFANSFLPSLEADTCVAQLMKSFASAFSNVNLRRVRPLSPFFASPMKTEPDGPGTIIWYCAAGSAKAIVRRSIPSTSMITSSGSFAGLSTTLLRKFYGQTCLQAISLKHPIILSETPEGQSYFLLLTSINILSMRAFKYISPFIIYIGSFRAFTVTGWEVWLPLIYAWLIIPLLELFIRPDPKNMTGTEEESAKKNRIYDLLLYFVVILQYAALVMFLYAMSHDEMTWIDIIGRVWVMGMLCGVFGISVGHELGQRVNKFEQVLAKMLLLSSQ
jgi:hypothetical protein